MPPIVVTGLKRVSRRDRRIDLLPVVVTGLKRVCRHDRRIEMFPVVVTGLSVTEDVIDTSECLKSACFFFHNYPVCGM